MPTGCKGISRDQKRKRQHEPKQKNPETLTPKVASSVMQIHVDYKANRILFCSVSKHKT